MKFLRILAFMTPFTVFQDGLVKICDSNGVCKVTYNSVKVITPERLQASTCNFLVSTNGTSSYTATLNECQLLRTYTKGQIFTLQVDVPNSNGNGSCTLNVDNLGAKAIKQSDGITDPGLNFLLAGSFHLVVYDGTLFRILA